MINKHSSQSKFSDQMVQEMDKALKVGQAERFSFAELTQTLVKCADQLDENGNTDLANEVDSLLGFIENEFMK